MHKKTTLVLGSFIGLALSGIVGAADMHTQVIASTCMSCHGPGGKSVGKNPNLAGQNKAFFVQSMKEFRSGEKPGTIMKRHAAGYTDAEIEAMGDYFASLK
ncbi:MAG: sulfide dehydrogenase [Thiobacillus sp. SCN 63-374]|uniref:c-type cytochrome n=1 Tax=Thiobacillus sp. TaxID=924 RepID=UPI00086F057C|nr:c-type cytochrome [Thiobacillus sp.]ODU45559.1 MAG: sulfide dehydrogenase [Thiobacillus sp. SCN 63-374]